MIFHSLISNKKKMRSDNSKNSNIYHCCIQKTASQWLKKVLAEELIEKYSNLKYRDPEMDYIVTKANRPSLSEGFEEGLIISPLYICYEDFKRMPKPASFKAFWIMRDPRDIMLSQYFSITYSHIVINENMKRTRQQLQEMPLKSGLLYFFEKIYPVHDPDFPYFVALRSWLHAKEDPHVLLIRFEDIVGVNQLGTFKNILNHCDVSIPDKNIQKVLQKYSFQKISGRKPGVDDKHSHYRKGIPGDWKNYFDKEICNIFKEAAGDLLSQMGYETNMTW